MDQKRLFLAIVISLGIMLGYQTFVAPLMPQPPVPAKTEAGNAPQATNAVGSTATPSVQPVASGQPVPKDVPRVKIVGRRVSGSISLLGARIDDLVLTDYRETVDAGSPFVRLLEPRSDEKPYYVQYGWTAASGETVKLPDNDTVWSSTAGPLSKDTPVALTWDNGEGLTFRIDLGLDDDYMFTVKQ